MMINFEIERSKDAAEITMYEAVRLVQAYVDGEISKQEILKALNQLKEKNKNVKN